MTHAMQTTPEQLLSALQVGGLDLRARCTACGAEKGVGDPVTVYAYRSAERARWDVARLYCRSCKRSLRPTVGATEVLATARLGSVAIPTGRTHRLCLTDVAMARFSPPGEGCRP